MPEEKKTIRKAHNIILENRRNLNVSGIEDVDSFDEETIVLFTDTGVLTIKGDDLHINKLSVETGELSVEGNIYSLEYSDEEAGKKGGGFFNKLFK